MKTWKSVPKKVVLACIDICDGHTIFPPDEFIKLGAPKELIDRVCKVHESNLDNPKGTIFNDAGGVIPLLKGVYGLQLLRIIANDLNVHYDSAFGRGTEARRIKEAIHKELGA